MGAIRGVVVDAAGQPAEGVRVCALDTASCATSDTLNGNPPLEHRRFSLYILHVLSLHRSSELARVGPGDAVLARRRDNRGDKFPAKPACRSASLSPRLFVASPETMRTTDIADPGVRVCAAGSYAAVVCAVDQKSRRNAMMSSMSCCVSRMFESVMGTPILEVNRNLYCSITSSRLFAELS